jgi:hypothetical protein
MKTLFNITLLLIVMSSFLHGQEEILFSKKFKTNTSTTALIELNISGTVEIEESMDDNFYVQHSIEFTNYSKRQKEKLLKELRDKYNVSATSEDNYIVTSCKNKSNKRNLYNIDYYMNTGYIRNENNDSLINKILFEDLINKMKEAKMPRFRYLQFIKNSKYLSDGRKQRIIDRYGKDSKSKRYHVKVKLKIPKNLNITINSKFTKVVFSGNIKNQFSIRCNGGRLFADVLNNKNNVIKVKDGVVMVESIVGGELSFNSTRTAIIGELNSVRLNTEFSQLEVGKIGNNVEITDFTSKFIIHNFSDSFNSFKMNTEYSEINMFFPENMEYYIETYGHDTYHHYDNVVGAVTPSRKNESTKMMVIGEETSPNKIKINTIHGIIRFGDDTIDFDE